MLWNGGESVARAAATDLDAHLVGPPSAGPLSVAKLDILAEWAASIVVSDVMVNFTAPVGNIYCGITLPAKSLVLSVQAKLQTNISRDPSTTRIGIGWDNGGDTGYNLYGQITSFTKNAGAPKIPNAWTVLPTLQELRLTAMGTTGGGVVGTIGAAGQSIRVKVVYFNSAPLPTVP